MIKVEDVEVMGIRKAIKGMRNPMNSWDKADSEGVVIGPKDLELAEKLAKSGADHRKFMRMIHVQADITAPLYWWKEYDTYKVGTVANSCSTMHTIHKKEFELDDFSHDRLDYDGERILSALIEYFNFCRENFLETKDKNWWWNIIQMIPTAYNQMRTIDLNYEVLFSIYHQRKNHKLDEWSGEKGFCKWIESLPYMWVFLELEEKENG